MLMFAACIKLLIGSLLGWPRQSRGVAHVLKYTYISLLSAGRSDCTLYISTLFHLVRFF